MDKQAELRAKYLKEFVEVDIGLETVQHLDVITKNLMQCLHLKDDNFVDELVRRGGLDQLLELLVIAQQRSPPLHFRVMVALFIVVFSRPKKHAEILLNIGGFPPLLKNLLDEGPYILPHMYAAVILRCMVAASDNLRVDVPEGTEAIFVVVMGELLRCENQRLATLVQDTIVSWFQTATSSDTAKRCLQLLLSILNKGCDDAMLQRMVHLLDVIVARCSSDALQSVLTTDEMPAFLRVLIQLVLSREPPTHAQTLISCVRELFKRGEKVAVLMIFDETLALLRFFYDHIHPQITKDIHLIIAYSIIYGERETVDRVFQENLLPSLWTLFNEATESEYTTITSLMKCVFLGRDHSAQFLSACVNPYLRRVKNERKWSSGGEFLNCFKPAEDIMSSDYWRTFRGLMQELGTTDLLNELYSHID